MRRRSAITFCDAGASGEAPVFLLVNGSKGEGDGELHMKGAFVPNLMDTDEPLMEERRLNG